MSAKHRKHSTQRCANSDAPYYESKDSDMERYESVEVTDEGVQQELPAWCGDQIGKGLRLAFVAPFERMPFAKTIRGIAQSLQERAAMQPLLPARPMTLPAVAVAGGVSLRKRDQSNGGQRP